jgi:enoyl-CoA hydratase/carnithine racemase
MSITNHTNAREDGVVLLERTGSIAMMTISRPGSLNALTWTMYEQMEAHLRTLASDETLRALVIRGAGKAFATGTDIHQFQGYTSADGALYERKMETIIEGLYNFPRPVIAAVHGYALGAGILFAAVADLRYATPSSRFGMPIARTLGNCLSMKNYHHLVEGFGAMRAKEMIFTGRLLSAQDALHYGFLTAIVEEDRIYAYVLEIAQQVSNHAPLTIWATKEAQRRINAAALRNTSFDDVMARVYDSHDFAEGVQAYGAKRKPRWTGEG